MKVTGAKLEGQDGSRLPEWAGAPHSLSSSGAGLPSDEQLLNSWLHKIIVDGGEGQGIRSLLFLISGSALTEN